MDSDFRIDLSEVARSVETADVVALYFPLLRKTLLMDTRSTELEGPMIKVVPMARTPEERFRSLLRLRPRFPRPESITIIPWPKYVDSLVRLGVWDHIVRRFSEVGSPQILRECDACLRQLTKLEREELRRAIRGERYQSLWPPSAEPAEEAPSEEEEAGPGEEEPM